MACTDNTGTSPGLLVAYAPTDNGERPLAANVAYWVSPNIRLALQGDVANLMDPAAWDSAQYANWNGQVDVGSTYTLMVRVSNTDTNAQRASLNLQGWVSDYTIGGVGPQSVILEDPAQPESGSNPPTQFTGFNLGPLGIPNANDPYSNMLVLYSPTQQAWTVNPDQHSVNGGHVCVAVNVWADATGNGTSTPVDGQIVGAGFIDPTCDRMYGQRNIQIVPVQQGQHVQIPAMLHVPVTDRCPLHAAIAIRPVELKVGQGGVLQDVPELSRAARDHAMTQLRQPEADPLQRVWCGPNGPGDGDHDRGPLRVNLEPGERTDVTVNLDTQNQRPGDAYALDLITTDTATGRLFGAARMFVLVTD
jgi:hypothetical protein